VLWVTRAPVTVFALGVLILWKVPQAQDLLIPLVDSKYYRIGLFFLVVFVLWAMPTHYAARLAIDDDERLAVHQRQAKSVFLDVLICQGPRLLGAATSLALMGCAYRARLDFPAVVGEDENVRNTIFAQLSWFMLWCAVWAALFWLYAAKRTTLIATSRFLLHAEARVAGAAAPVRPRDRGSRQYCLERPDYPPEPQTMVALLRRTWPILTGGQRPPGSAPLVHSLRPMRHALRFPASTQPPTRVQSAGVDLAGFLACP
jgi:hypothetical protein